jgi:hypothetical protein
MDNEWLDNLQPEYREFARRVYSLAEGEYYHGQQDLVMVMMQMGVHEQVQRLFTNLELSAIAKFVGLVKVSVDQTVEKWKAGGNG